MYNNHLAVGRPQSLFFERLCLSVFPYSTPPPPHSSKRVAGVPGHPREQREADRRAEEDVGSERRLFEERVGEEGTIRWEKLKAMHILDHCVLYRISSLLSPHVKTEPPKPWCSMLSCTWVSRTGIGRSTSFRSSVWHVHGSLHIG